MAPSYISASEKDKITIPIIVNNDRNIILQDLRLNATTNAKGIELTFDNDYIPILKGFEKATRNLTIITNKYSSPGLYDITVTVRVGYPSFEDSIKIVIGLGTLADNKTIRVKFAQDLFKENPECLELNDMLLQAKKALEEKKVDKARSLVEASIQMCRDLVTSRGKEIKIPATRNYRLLFKILIPTIIILSLVIIYRSYKAGIRKGKFSRFGKAITVTEKEEPSKKMGFSNPFSKLFKRKKNKSKTKNRDAWTRNK